MREQEGVKLPHVGSLTPPTRLAYLSPVASGLTRHVTNSEGCATVLHPRADVIGLYIRSLGPGQGFSDSRLWRRIGPCLQPQPG